MISLKGLTAKSNQTNNLDHVDGSVHSKKKVAALNLSTINSDAEVMSTYFDELKQCKNMLS